LNDVGQVAGYISLFTNQYSYTLATYRAGAYNTGPAGLSPDAINNAGQIVGAEVLAYQGFLYSNGSLTTIGPLPYAINNSGVAVGTTLEVNRRAFMYQNGQLTYLAPPGAVSAEAFAVNDSGLIAGTFSNRSTNLEQLFVY